jgi:hypothetical protein
LHKTTSLLIHSCRIGWALVEHSSYFWFFNHPHSVGAYDFTGALACGIGALPAVTGVAAGGNKVFNAWFGGGEVKEIWIGVVVNVSRWVISVVIGEDGLLFVFTELVVDICVEGALVAI